jgi:hypothetical protein
MGAYDQFLLTKSQLDGEYGFDPVWMPDFLIDFQSAMVEWACRKGRRMSPAAQLMTWLGALIGSARPSPAGKAD